MKETLRKRATKAVSLIEGLNGLFKNDRKQNTIAIIMLAIEDAYRQGKEDVLNPPKEGACQCGECKEIAQERP